MNILYVGTKGVGKSAIGATREAFSKQPEGENHNLVFLLNTMGLNKQNSEHSDIITSKINEFNKSFSNLNASRNIEYEILTPTNLDEAISSLNKYKFDYTLMSAHGECKNADLKLSLEAALKDFGIDVEVYNYLESKGLHQEKKKIDNYRFIEVINNWEAVETLAKIEKHVSLGIKDIMSNPTELLTYLSASISGKIDSTFGNVHIDTHRTRHEAFVKFNEFLSFNGGKQIYGSFALDENAIIAGHHSQGGVPLLNEARITRASKPEEDFSKIVGAEFYYFLRDYIRKYSSETSKDILRDHVYPSHLKLIEGLFECRDPHAAYKKFGMSIFTKITEEESTKYYAISSQEKIKELKYGDQGVYIGYPTKFLLNDQGNYFWKSENARFTKKAFDDFLDSYISIHKLIDKFIDHGLLNRIDFKSDEKNIVNNNKNQFKTNKLKKEDNTSYKINTIKEKKIFGATYKGNEVIEWDINIPGKPNVYRSVMDNEPRSALDVIVKNIDDKRLMFVATKKGIFSIDLDSNERKEYLLKSFDESIAYFDSIEVINDQLYGGHSRINSKKDMKGKGLFRWDISSGSMKQILSEPAYKLSNYDLNGKEKLFFASNENLCFLNKDNKSHVVSKNGEVISSYALGEHIRVGGVHGTLTTFNWSKHKIDYKDFKHNFPITSIVSADYDGKEYVMCGNSVGGLNIVLGDDVTNINIGKDRIGKRGINCMKIYDENDPKLLVAMGSYIYDIKFEELLKVYDKIHFDENAKIYAGSGGEIRSFEVL